MKKAEQSLGLVIFKVYENGASRTSATEKEGKVIKVETYNERSSQTNNKSKTLIKATRPKNAQPLRKIKPRPLRIIRCLTEGSSHNLGLGFIY